DLDYIRSSHVHGLPGTGGDRTVSSSPLAGTKSGAQGPEKGQVSHGGYHFLNTHNHDMRFGQRATEARISFILGNRYTANIGNDEIGAGYPHFGTGIFLTQYPAGYQGQFLGAQFGIGTQLFGK